MEIIQRSAKCQKATFAAFLDDIDSGAALGYQRRGQGAKGARGRFRADPGQVIEFLEPYRPLLLNKPALRRSEKRL
jgi:hypothetical protein